MAMGNIHWDRMVIHQKNRSKNKIDLRLGTHDSACIIVFFFLTLVSFTRICRSS